MRLLVFSDSHGVAYYMRQALLAHPEADMIIFLGDGERDLDSVEFEINGRPLVKVRGNCDFGSHLNAVEIIRAGGKTVYITHGFAEHVKHGISELMDTARGYNADIVLFGHTHEQMTLYEDGMYIMNPGSVNDGYYGMVDITPKGIMTIPARV